MQADGNRALPGRVVWWAVRRGRWTGVTSDRMTMNLATDGLGGAEFARFPTEAEARAWLEDPDRPPIQRIQDEPQPVLWAVYAGKRPGIYEKAAEAERAAGKMGWSRPFCSPLWGARYAQTGVYGMQPGMQDVRPAYAHPWTSPRFQGGWPSAHASIATATVEGGVRWALRLLPFGPLPSWALRGKHEGEANLPTMHALALSEAFLELLTFVWGERDDPHGGFLLPGHRVSLLVVTNCRSWQGLARGDWRLPPMEETRRRLQELPVSVVLDRQDAWCARALKD